MIPGEHSWHIEDPPDPPPTGGDWGVPWIPDDEI